jgi:hypothetical protein
MVGISVVQWADTLASDDDFMAAFREIYGAGKSNLTINKAEQLVERIRLALPAPDNENSRAACQILLEIAKRFSEANVSN